jgi:hypothetical protein
VGSSSSPSAEQARQNQNPTPDLKPLSQPESKERKTPMTTLTPILHRIDYAASTVLESLKMCRLPEERVLAEKYQSAFNQLVILRQWLVIDEQIGRVVDWDGPEFTKRVFFKETRELFFEE